MPEKDTQDFNPWLADDVSGENPNKGGPEAIQDPHNPVNLVWQTRAQPPTPYEIELGDALERIFADGIKEIPGVVERLNQDGPAFAEGEWTDEIFQAEMKRLGG